LLLLFQYLATLLFKHYGATKQLKPGKADHINTMVEVNNYNSMIKEEERNKKSVVVIKLHK